MPDQSLPVPENFSPWKADLDRVLGEDGSDGTVAHCFGPNRFTNAKVMAAAQELLAALVTAVSTIEQLIPEPSVRGVADVVLAQARAAIAKATGSTS